MTQSHKLFAWMIGAVLVLLVLIRLLTVYTDYLWMGSVDQAPVFVKLFWAKVLLGLIVGVVFFAWLWLHLRLARRKQPEDITLIGKRLLPEEDRQQIEKHADKALFLFALMGALFAALAAARQALPWLLYVNWEPFGQLDPLFAKDAGFYVFRLPFLQYLYHAGMAMVVLALIFVVLLHLYQENIRLVGNTIHANRGARWHCLSLLALALLIKTYGYRLAQYNLLFSTQSQTFSGASYADIYARLPVLWMMMALVVATAALVLVTIRRRDFKLAGWALSLMLVFSLVGGSVYPLAIQRLVVGPNELDKEQRFISYNIAATRYAYDLEKANRQMYPIKGALSAVQLQESRETLKSIRLWDYRPLEATYDMEQALRAYYSFPGIDVDRYLVNGELRQVSISGRQLDYGKLQEKTWVNQHLIYTHGYGAVVSPVNDATGRGLPIMWVAGLPPRSTVPGMGIEQPALYYMCSAVPPLIEWVSSPETIAAPESQASPPPSSAMPGQPAPPPAAPLSPLAKTPAQEIPYVLVNTKQLELDYPAVAEAGAAAPAGNQMVHYAGTGGVKINTFLRKLAFAGRFMDIQILLTTYLTPESRIQLNRYLPQRLQAIAPFIMYDPDPYLFIEGGQLKWICDAYTASNRYPYSALVTRVSKEKINLPPLNYLRNSIKVVVDAYTGRPTFYVIDPSDPLVRCYRKIFPSLFTDAAQMTPTTREHLRYPLFLFMTQAKVYGLYHMQDPTTFYNREDWWALPPEIFAQTRRMTEPYYVVMKLPHAEREQFLLMIPYVLTGREERVAVAWMAGICDEPDYGKLIVYDFPKGKTVQGPWMIEARINQDPQISSYFTLWGQEGSRVIRGNLLMIPLDGSLLYVEPVYLVASDNPVPELHQVILAYGDDIVMEPTLDRALYRMFGSDLKLSELGLPAVPAGEQVGPPSVEALLPGVPSQPGNLGDLIQQALALETESEQALSRGDLGTYQQKQHQQAEILRQIDKLQAP